MIVDTAANTYKISFRHYGWPAIKGVRPRSTCFIHRKDGDEYALASIGDSTCHPNDQPSKERGRKVALQNALRRGGFNRDARACFWRAYLGRIQNYPDRDTVIDRVRSLAPEQYEALVALLNEMTKMPEGRLTTSK